MNKNLKQIAVPLVSVLLGLVLGAIIMWAFSYDALWGYELLFKKAFGSIKSWGNISRAMGPLILVALGFSVASRAGFFNVGLPGQAFAGWIMATWFALSFPNMPRLLMIPMTVLIAAIAGGFIGAIPGFLRAYLGTSEVIITIMMNYIVLYGGMSLHTGQLMPTPGGQSAQCHSLVQLNIITDLRGLSDHHAGSMVNKEILSYGRPRIDVNPGLIVGVFRHNARDIGHIFQIQLMGNPIDIDGKQPRIAEDNLLLALCRRISVKAGLNVL